MKNIVEALQMKGYSISTAESLTAGLVSSRICEIAGASKVFKGGAVTYSKEMKCKMLNIQSRIIEEYGVYSNETVIEMAKGISNVCSSDTSIATSGVAGPGSDEGVEAGTVYFCFKILDEYKTECIVFGGNRNEIRAQAADYAIKRMVELL